MSTGTGRYLVPSTRLASKVLSGSSARKMTANVVSATTMLVTRGSSPRVPGRWRLLRRGSVKLRPKVSPSTFAVPRAPGP